MTKAYVAYILHRRHYRETSLLMDVFTREVGRVGMICKGGRKQKHLAYLLRPFKPLTIYVHAERELSTITNIETRGGDIFLQDDQLIAGMYLNELLLRILPKGEAYESLFDMYEKTLQIIATVNDMHIGIRQFEYCLLTTAGYAIDLKCDASNEPIMIERNYYFNPSEGFVPTLNTAKNSLIFSGRAIRSIESWHFDDNETRYAARKLMQIALAPLLGVKPLMSLKLLNDKRRMMRELAQ